MAALREAVFHYLEVEEDDRGAQRVLNLTLAGLIGLNVAAVMLETVPELQRAYGAAFLAFERGSLAVFALEYLLRLWSCVQDPRYAGGWRGRLRFATSAYALIDLAAILPGLIPGSRLDLRFARALRLMRLLRVLKLARYSASLRILGQVLTSRRTELGITSFAGAVVLICAACGIYFLEHDSQPQAFPSIPASLWWGAMTLTTVGYGDVYPVTAAGKLLAALIAVTGVGLFALPAGILAGGFSEQLNKLRAGKRACPHCGGALED